MGGWNRGGGVVEKQIVKDPKSSHKLRPCAILQGQGVSQARLFFYELDGAKNESGYIRKNESDSLVSNGRS